MPLAYKRAPKAEQRAEAEDRPKVRSLADMTTEQLRALDEAMQPFRPFDTVREIREALAKQTGAEMHELANVEGDWGDRFNYDPALAEKNPLYKFMVVEWNANKIQADQRILAFKKELDYYATAARRSRRRSITDRLVPSDPLVVKWLQPFETTYV